MKSVSNYWDTEITINLTIPKGAKTLRSLFSLYCQKYSHYLSLILKFEKICNFVVGIPKPKPFLKISVSNVNIKFKKTSKISIKTHLIFVFQIILNHLVQKLDDVFEYFMDML